ncbi:hypothetical protein VFPPC_02854 [Pochonia chlamydosporia 170]|uniref:Uncharacterized protein n=1 Tax=Pochonia chlamydosporia 170 TaxID=1380566 RepID=A0A179FXL7_METCM|nr:hypothetical protein VFPPC_02854 [Pochonia chlamydosporia 170]OAQ70372.1 hypothetical protein VFPPC_02854 [Pochonia chlamydosporia 170]
MLGVRDAAASSPMGGRSRYSKALPSVPVVDSTRAELPPLPKVLPELHFPLPPQTPSRENDDNKSIKSIARKPVGSSTSKPITPLPDTPSVNSPPLPTSSSAGSMTIPRKAVGGALQPPVQPTIVVPPEPSPTDSICSLLSAYSREPDAPLPGSTYTAASTANNLFRDSNKGPSLGRDDSSAGGRSNSQTPLSTVKSDEISAQNGQSRPAPPPKDNGFHPTSSPPKPLPVAPVTEKPSPPRPEIWKRRPQTAEKNKELPDLKLNYSHGSTASTSSIKSIQTAVLKAFSGTGAESKLPTEEPKQKSTQRPPAVGLPGRNVRPPPKDTNQETEKQMGSTSSKLQSVKNKFESTRTSVDRKDLPVRRDSKRPPTPEYRKGDVSPPSAQTETIVKPASPVSATGSPKERALTDASKSTSPQTIVPSNFEAAVPTPPPGSLNRLPQAAPDLRLATSLQELRRHEPSPPRSSSPSAHRAQFPPRGDSSRGISGSSDSVSSRISSGQGGIGPSYGEPRRPATATGSSDPRIVMSDAQGPMYRGRDGTLYPEMKIAGDPDPRAAYFPVQTDKPLGPGAIIPAKPLTQTHYNCFQKHRTMNRRSNRNYPLTCQTCDKADVEDRWVCTFCHLRICETCLRGLNGHQKVLRSLVDQLRTNTPLSLSSTSRPGSALGIELHF